MSNVPIEPQRTGPYPFQVTAQRQLTQSNHRIESLTGQENVNRPEKFNAKKRKKDFSHVAKTTLIFIFVDHEVASDPRAKYDETLKLTTMLLIRILGVVNSF